MQLSLTRELYKNKNESNKVDFNDAWAIKPGVQSTL